LSGGATVALLAAAAVGHGALRRAGVGPMGSLVGAGKLGTRDRILIADFANTTADTVLSTVVTEAFRTDFTQSRAISVVGRPAVSAVLERMQRPTGARLDPALAREVAVRDGVKGVIEGDVAKVGGQYILSARLVSPQGGEVLAAFRETADGDRELIGAIDRLSKQLREKIGESLQTIRASGGLERVTTTSLDALRKYTEAIRAGDAPDIEQREHEIALLREAVALDSTFAMAWRRLGVRLGNGPAVDPAQVVDAISRAYRLRDRLSPVERGLAEASYYTEVTKDNERAAAAYLGVLEIDPDNRIALNNMAIKVQATGGPDSLLISYGRRLMAVDSSAASSYVWMTEGYYRLGQVDSAQASARRFAQHFGVGPATVFSLAHWLTFDRRYDSATAMIRRTLDDPRYGPAARSGSFSQLAALASLRGRLVEAARYDDQWRQQRAAEDSNFRRMLPLMQLADEAQNLAWRRQEPALARAALERGFRATPPDRLPLTVQRPSDVAFYWALAGDAPRARQSLDAYQRLGSKLPPELHARYAADSADEVNASGAWIAAAEGQASRAVELTRPIVQRHRSGYLGSLATLGFFYAAAHQPDSAIAVLERFVNSRDPDRAWFEPFYLPRAYQELGVQYEALGQRAKAAAAYQSFIDLWRNADPELQPQVRKAREALARVTGEPRRAN
jgi:tetratricopeptide (TPR) repeat protein